MTLPTPQSRSPGKAVAIDGKSSDAPAVASLCTLCAFCVGVAAPSQPFLNDSVLQAVELPATWPGRLIVGVADTPERPPRLSLA